MITDAPYYGTDDVGSTAMTLYGRPGTVDRRLAITEMGRVYINLAQYLAMVPAYIQNNTLLVPIDPRVLIERFGFPGRYISENMKRAAPLAIAGGDGDDYEPAVRKRLRTEDPDTYNTLVTDMVENSMSDYKNNIMKKYMDKFASMLANRDYTAAEMAEYTRLLLDLGEYTYKHYVHFMLFPVESPFKIKPPSDSIFPTNTELRMFKNQLTIPLTSTGFQLKGVWCPYINGDPNVTTSTFVMTTGSQTNINGQLSDEVISLNGLFPAIYPQMFTQHRLVAAELRIRIIQNIDEQRGEIYATREVFVGDKPTGLVDSDATDVRASTIIDNTNLIQLPAISGLRLIWLPWGTRYKDMQSTTSPGTSDLEPQNQVNWNKILIKGLPINSEITVTQWIFVECLPNPDVDEAILSPDRFSQPGQTKGSSAEVHNALVAVQKTDTTLVGGPIVSRNNSFWDGATDFVDKYSDKLWDVAKEYGPQVLTTIGQYGMKALGPLLAIA